MSSVEHGGLLAEMPLVDEATAAGLGGVMLEGYEGPAADIAGTLEGDTLGQQITGTPDSGGAFSFRPN